jgi:predicted secreted protein
MRRLVPALCTAALAITLAMPAGAQNALPPGEGRDLLATACSQCHALNVIRSMREGAEGWKRHVYNMVTRGAQLNAREADMVVAYLAANFGPTAPAAAATPVALPSGSGKELVETRSIGQAAEIAMAGVGRQHGQPRRRGDTRGSAGY